MVSDGSENRLDLLSDVPPKEAFQAGLPPGKYKVWKGGFGICPNCQENNSDYNWCQLCDPNLLTQGWTSGNEKIDYLIKTTQRKAKGLDDYLEWIPYNYFKDIEKIGEGGFGNIYKATWMDYRERSTVDQASGYTTVNKHWDEIVALKQLKNSQNISDEFLHEVNNLVFYVLIY